MDTYNYFPSAIYREERPEWVEETIKQSQKYYGETRAWLPDGELITQTGPMMRDKDLGYLASYFKDKSVSILKEQGYSTDEYEFYLSGMWGQEFACTASNIMHVHGDSQLSGFYFLDVAEGGSYPVFDDPRPGKKMADLQAISNDELTMASSYVHFNSVQSGTLLLFNSWLPHMITQNQSEKKTKFIHFNLSCTKRFI